MGKEIKRCVIISGAPEDDLSYYDPYLNKDSFVICADSGYKKCIVLDVRPDLIVGDFDSADKPDADCEIISLQVRKDDTDTFHCVKEAIDRGFRDIIILGGIGSRLDHTYSNILSVNYCYERNISCALVNKHNKISIISGRTVIDNSLYEHFSLFALFDKCEGLSILNSLYELHDVELLPNEQYTQSNGFIDDSCEIIIKKGKLLLIQSND